MRALVVVFAGEYDLSCRALLQQELERVEREPLLVLDFSAVTFVDSTCLGLLIKLHTTRSENGDQKATIAAGQHLRKVFEIVGLTRLLLVVDGLEAAVGSDPDLVVEHAFYGGSEPN